MCRYPSREILAPDDNIFHGNDRVTMLYYARNESIRVWRVSGIIYPYQISMLSTATIFTEVYMLFTTWV